MALVSIIFSSLFKIISFGASYKKGYNELLNEVEKSTLFYVNAKEQIRALEANNKICGTHIKDIKSVHHKLGNYLRQFQATGKIMQHLREQNLELTEILRRSRSLSRSRTPQKDAGYLKRRMDKFKIYYEPGSYSEQLKYLRDWINSEIDNARRSADLGVKCARPAGTVKRVVMGTHKPKIPAGTVKRIPAGTIKPKSPRKYVLYKPAGTVKPRSPRRINPLLNSYV